MHDNGGEGGVGTSFTFPISIPYSQILVCYSTYIQWGWEIESHLRPRRVRVSSSHPVMDIFFNKKEVFFNPGHNVVMHYPIKRWWWSMTMVMAKKETEGVSVIWRDENLIVRVK